MTPKEAIELLRETNEPLAVILEDLLRRQDQLQHSQVAVIEALVAHLMTPPGKPSTIDITEIIKAITTYKKN